MATANPLARLAPSPTPETTPFWQGTKRHQLMLTVAPLTVVGPEASRSAVAPLSVKPA